MKKKFLITAFIILAVAVGSVIYISAKNSERHTQLTTKKVTRGNVATIVSSTGTINAVGTVDVGTQVSGVIDKIFVDFNDHVKKGQLMAVLDTVMLKASVMEAEASYNKAKALLEQARSDNDRNFKLFRQNLISEADYLPFKISLETQESDLKSAAAALKKAKQNLKYAFIYSPISGTIIERSVEEGQTVAASLSAPVLFTIAEDLAHMEIYALVDESDIGQIKEGQRTTFSVQAYPDKVFDGVVRQVRLQPQEVSNVVNYTVIVSAENSDGLLLPGMTADVDFYVAEKNDALLIPNAALHFQPSEEMLKEFRADKNKSQHEQPGKKIPSVDTSKSMVWYLDDQGRVSIAPVSTGISDGKLTEIVSSSKIKEGTRVITAVSSDESGVIASSGRTRMRFGGPRPF